MKLSLTLSLLLGMATLFQGCGSTEETPAETKKESTTIKGSTTLSSGFQSESKAVVCLDLNKNEDCDENEPQTTTDILGQYEFTVPLNVEEGTLIIAKGGKNMLPRADGNTSMSNQLVFTKYYNSDERSQNINAMSTYIALEMAANPSYTYKDVIDTFANKYDFDAEMITADPIDVGDNLFGDGEDFYKKLAAMEIYMAKDINTTNRSAALHRAADAETSSDAPSDDELDAIIEEYSSIFDEYLAWLSEWWDSLFEDDAEEEVTPPVVVDPTPDPEPEPEQPKLVEIQRDHLNGIWYIIDASGDKTCSDIRSNNNIAVTEADGKTTDLTLTYDNNKKTMLLKLGFFTADTIKFDKYYESSTEKTFTGNYESDGETLSGYKMDTLANCKSSKLGL